jgi:hypothetical protein
MHVTHSLRFNQKKKKINTKGRRHCKLHDKLSRVYCQKVEIWKILQITCSFDKIFSFSPFFFPLFKKKKIKTLAKTTIHKILQT